MSSKGDGKTIKGIYLGKEKVILRFSDSKLDISHNTYLEFRLYEGKVLSNEELKEISKIDALDKYLTYAKKLVLSSLKSEKSIRDKLIAKGAKARQIDYIVKELKRYDLINDVSLAKSLTEDLLNKHYGINRIKSFLYQKGIPSEIVDSINIKDEDKNAKEIIPLLEKRYSKYNYKAKCDRIYNALLRLGYSYDIASEAISLVKRNDSKTELELLKKDYLKVKANYMKKYPKEVREQKINEYLLRKGYSYKDITKVKGE